MNREIELVREYASRYDKPFIVADMINRMVSDGLKYVPTSRAAGLYLNRMGYKKKGRTTNSSKTIYFAKTRTP